MTAEVSPALIMRADSSTSRAAARSSAIGVARCETASDPEPGVTQPGPSRIKKEAATTDDTIPNVVDFRLFTRNPPFLGSGCGYLFLSTLLGDSLSTISCVMFSVGIGGSKLPRYPWAAMKSYPDCWPTSEMTRTARSLA